MPLMGASWMPYFLYEDTIDSFIMLINSVPLLIINIAYVIAILLFNLTGMVITDYVNAMVRNILEPVRCITIWGTSVFLYYVVWRAIGENVGYFTIVEMIGFILFAIGFLLYTKVIKLPFFKYPKEEEKEEDKTKSQEEKEPLLY